MMLMVKLGERDAKVVQSLKQVQRMIYYHYT